MGYEVVEKTYYTPEDTYGDERLLNMIEKDVVATRCDCVFTVNIWPLAARACHNKRVPYIAWSYDSPQNLPTNQDLDYDTNFLFIFDRAEVELYHKEGIEQVYHMPLAADIERWDKIKTGSSAAGKVSTGSGKNASTESKIDGNTIGKKYDVSLLGTLYESTLPMLLSGMNEYHSGYVSGLVEAQKKIYGYFLVDDLLTDEFMKSLNQQFREKNPKMGEVSKKQMAYSIGSYLTYIERLSLLRLLGSRADVHLFSSKIKEETLPLLKDISIHDWVSYEEGMPKVFKESKINLNPSLRVIRSGISLRCMDVLGCGGFLLSSYQPEMAEYFVPDEEVVLYDSMEDAVEKTMFYLEHDDIREAIAHNGYEKVKAEFNYPKQLKQVFKTVGLES